MDFIRKEIYQQEENYTNKTIDTKFFRERKVCFEDSYGKFFDSLDDESKRQLGYLKLIGYQMFHEACAENFARGFRCAMRLVCDSMSNDNDGEPEILVVD